jgi:hypothetical protein
VLLPASLSPSTTQAPPPAMIAPAWKLSRPAQRAASAAAGARYGCTRSCSGGGAASRNVTRAGERCTVTQPPCSGSSARCGPTMSPSGPDPAGGSWRISSSGHSAGASTRSWRAGSTPWSRKP